MGCNPTVRYGNMTNRFQPNPNGRSGILRLPPKKLKPNSGVMCWV
jgi:hypothetical protein